MEHVNELGEALPQQICEMLHVEVCKTQHSVAKNNEVKKHAIQYLEETPLKFGDIFTHFVGYDFLSNNVDHIVVCDPNTWSSVNATIDKSRTKLCIYTYQLNAEGAASEELDEEEDISAANHWVLPSADFEGLWENLIFDTDVKQQLLNYSSTTLLFSDKGVDANIIAWNRVVLLHGPPGTGKTSLCKALAQKLTIRHQDRFRYGQLIEINSHSLFSKWFSESGKLVMKMFQRIQELIDDPESLVCVLIDEVESLTAARTAAMKGTEPSDAIRVVNALLTQIDQIKKYPNVLILTTSNITGAIDLAFVDRADIKQYIGPPSENAIFAIYHSCINELKKKQIISRSNLPDLRTLKMMRFQENEANSISFRLFDCARKSYGLSGRTLRKLPFLAHALYLQSYSCVTQEQFIAALSKCVDKQLEDRELLCNGETKQQLEQKPIVKSERTDSQVNGEILTNGVWH